MDFGSMNFVSMSPDLMGLGPCCRGISDSWYIGFSFPGDFFIAEKSSVSDCLALVCVRIFGWV